MQNRLKPRKIPQQQRSQRTREEILEASARLWNRHSFEEVSTNHIARKTGVSVGTLYKYYPNKDSILADLSLKYMQKDAELIGGIIDKYRTSQLSLLLDAMVDALIEVHDYDARVRGVIYQNLGRLGLVSAAQATRQNIQAKSSIATPELNPGLTWVTMTAITSVLFSMSQLQPQHRNWRFARDLCRQALELLLTPQGSTSS